MSEIGFFEDPRFDKTVEDAKTKGQKEAAFFSAGFVHCALRTRMPWDILIY
jgi:hypothetical protein